MTTETPAADAERERLIACIRKGCFTRTDGSVVMCDDCKATERMLRADARTIATLTQQVAHVDAVTERNHVLTEQLERAQAELRKMREAFERTVELTQENEGCVCKGNWRNILAEVRHLIGRKFICDSPRGKGLYTFFGLVDGEDDYYYGMYSKDHGLILLSCVGSIEGHGWKLAAPEAAPKQSADGG